MQVRSIKAKKTLLYLAIRMGEDVVKKVFFKFDRSFNHSYLSIRMGEVMKKIYDFLKFERSFNH